ncbi:MAG: hypothetical protein KME11_22855 [Timaviella obliquedivisa GSE-PSE-MK23-08B]|nr:hypothetical protein [Timaviella obliquedivisa GSE-PSE-MK23-08B]
MEFLFERFVADEANAALLNRGMGSVLDLWNAIFTQSQFAGATYFSF